MTKIKFIGVLIAATLSTACTMNNSNQQDERVITNTPKKLAIEEIRDVAVEARDELRLLAKTQQALAMNSLTEEQHRQRFYQATYVPEGFESEVTLNIQDRAEKVAKAIATIAGYDFDVSGNNVHGNPMVNINIDNQPLNEALKELGMQTGGLVDVEVYPASKIMVFKYLSE